MTPAICIDCGVSFHREAGEGWKTRCFDCWRDNAQRTGRWQRRTANEAGPLDELAANLPALLQLCHPDRHNSSVLSTRVTQWLLATRKRLSVLDRAA